MNSYPRLFMTSGGVEHGSFWTVDYSLHLIVFATISALLLLMTICTEARENGLDYERSKVRISVRLRSIVLG
ncbi:MAG: hypothetical protein KAH64_03035, partial [Nitrosomonadaceae bacterium]|nr:hypothetical protein [Nitrosomonadaceae bacterium]